MSSQSVIDFVQTLTLSPSHSLPLCNSSFSATKPLEASGKD
jgi:hypothetical protein